jgi:hypothetical protein
VEIPCKDVADPADLDTSHTGAGGAADPGEDDRDNPATAIRLIKIEVRGGPHHRAR